MYQSASGGFYKYFSPLHGKYENARYFQIKMKQTSEITLYQKKLL